jgi:orotidine-5'-phosphate decarboxylase
LEADGKPLYLHVAALAETLNVHGNVGLVVGATAPEQVAELRAVTDLPFLIPGVGAQGGDLEGSVRAAWNGDPASCLIASSRSILYADNPAREASAMRARINEIVGAVA